MRVRVRLQGEGEGVGEGEGKEEALSKAGNTEKPGGRSMATTVAQG